MKKATIAAVAFSLFSSAPMAEPTPQKISLIKPPEPVSYTVRNSWHIIPTILLAPTSLIIQAIANSSAGSRFSDEFARQMPMLSDALMDSLEKEFTSLGFEVTRTEQFRANPAKPYEIDNAAFQASDSLNVYAYFEYVGLYSGWSKSYYEPSVAINTCVDRKADKSCKIDLSAAYGSGYDDDGITYFAARPVDRWFGSSELSMRASDIKIAMHHGIGLIARGIALQIKTQSENNTGK